MNFSYPYGSSGMMGFMPDLSQIGSIIGTVLTVLSVVSLMAFAFSVLVYILYSLSLYTIAVRREINHPWLAFLPCANLWVLGCISDQYQYVVKGRVKNRRKTMVGLQIAIVALSMISSGVALGVAVNMLSHLNEIVMGGMTTGMGMLLVEGVTALAIMVLSIVLVVVQYMCLYDLYASCNPGTKVVFLLLSLFIGVTLPFLLFISRKKDQGMPPLRTDPVYYQTVDPAAYQPAEPVDYQPAEPVDYQPAEPADPAPYNEEPGSFE